VTGTSRRTVPFGPWCMVMDVARTCSQLCRNTSWPRENSLEHAICRVLEAGDKAVHLTRGPRPGNVFYFLPFVNTTSGYLTLKFRLHVLSMYLIMWLLGGPRWISSSGLLLRRQNARPTEHRHRKCEPHDPPQWKKVGKVGSDRDWDEAPLMPERTDGPKTGILSFRLLDRA